MATVVVNENAKAMTESIRIENAKAMVESICIKKAIGKPWRICGGGNDSEDDSDDKATDTALGTTNANIKCYNCGEMGHYSSNYPKQKINEMGKKFMGSCFLCGKQGHRKDECWELESKSSKRPNGWVFSMNKNQEASGAKIEVLVASVCMEFKEMIEEIGNNERAMTSKISEGVGIENTMTRTMHECIGIDVNKKAMTSKISKGIGIKNTMTRTIHERIGINLTEKAMTNSIGFEIETNKNENVDKKEMSFGNGNGDSNISEWCDVEASDVEHGRVSDGYVLWT